MDVVVLTALDLEYRAVRDHLTDVETQHHSAGTIFEVGTPPGGDGRVAVAVVGEGNNSAAVLAERAIAMFQPAAVLFVGIAGALRDDLRIGDVVVGTKVYPYHGGKEDDRGFNARPRAYEAPHELEQLARHLINARSWRDRPDVPVVHLKPIAAGEVVLDSRTATLAARLREHYNDAVAIEMESAGIASAGHLNQSLPWLSVRGISDAADGRKQTTDGAGSQPLAARNAARFAFALIDAMIARRSGPARPDPGRPGSSMTIVADRGGQAFGAQHGDVHVHPAGPPAPPGWQPADPAPAVSWRTDLTGQPLVAGYGALELHLVPVKSAGRVEVRRMRTLADDLAAAARTYELFEQSQAVDVYSDDTVARVTVAEGPGTRGSAITRLGQRSAWAPLPRDLLGLVLDEEDIARQLARLCTVLVGLGLPAADRYAVAVGTDTAASTSIGRVDEMPRGQSTPAVWTPQQVRVPADESMPLAGLGQDAAEELAARLLAAFRRTNRIG
ncbi:hypothetical protein [Actinoplanes sp. NPDC049265]|uniref:5'-methylthioadenosine/S-adenosylhomocysteine nucleosidase family protein n=1 Tax=Actinoplanes sp. NPDC049265 TaxID=3363902 RepID=UPI003720B482